MGAFSGLLDSDFLHVKSRKPSMRACAWGGTCGWTAAAWRTWSRTASRQ